MGQPSQYGLRTCLLAVRLGALFGLSDDEASAVHSLSLLRFVGCTVAGPVEALTFGGDEVAATTPAPAALVALWHLGGAMNRGGPSDTARSK